MSKNKFLAVGQKEVLALLRQLGTDRAIAYPVVFRTIGPRLRMTRAEIINALLSLEARGLVRLQRGGRGRDGAGCGVEVLREHTEVPA